jgi:ABC-type lipoprotein release transport system permease subunit
MALGADATRTATAVVREMFLLAIAGVVMGLAIAAADARVLQGFLLGVSDRDPVTFVAVPLVLTTVALLAAASPARRASRVDPLTVLRGE